MLAAGSTGSKASRKQRKSSYATPGAKGKLLPGEKARLKRARVDAKRAARSEGHGFNAPSVVRELESFVQAAGDIKVGLYAHLDSLTRCCCSIENLAPAPLWHSMSCSTCVRWDAMHDCISTSPDAWTPRIKYEPCT